MLAQCDSGRVSHEFVLQTIVKDHELSQICGKPVKYYKTHNSIPMGLLPAAVPVPPSSDARASAARTYMVPLPS